jgi:ubiquinone/menaquinone biosynthesis C-methylase UbiE
MSRSSSRQVDATLQHYGSSEGARSYSTLYQSKLHKRMSMRAEQRLLTRASSAMGRARTLLDVPSGPGRLYPFIAEHAEWTVECDYSAEMLKLLRSVASDMGRRPPLVSADAFELPFRDCAFEVVTSIRLLHHIPGADDRERCLRELLRVCQSSCLVTFFDFDSPKNRIRRLCAALGSKKRAKYTMKPSRVREVARECGFEWMNAWAISRFLSGHLFVWLRRTKPEPPMLSSEAPPPGQDANLWARLADPQTHEPLRFEGERLVRPDGVGYPIVDGIPMLHVARQLAPAR